MLSIQLAPPESPYLTELYKLLNHEWDDLEAFSETKNGKVIPSPIIALDDEQLIGGLVFTRFLSPVSQKQALWINALFIKPENRHQGISSQLIKRAQQLIKQRGERELLVYTHIPQLYLKQQWQTIETDQGNYVLTSKLPCTTSN